MGEDETIEEQVNLNKELQNLKNKEDVERRESELIEGQLELDNERKKLKKKEEEILEIPFFYVLLSFLSLNPSYLLFLVAASLLLRCRFLFGCSLFLGSCLLFGGILLPH